MMDGRVKTLHPKVHGGLLAVRDNPEHIRRDGEPRDRSDRPGGRQSLPVRGDVIAGAGRDEIIENIDIGGPSMVRSAAKNHAFVTIVTDPADYDELLAELDRQRRRDVARLRKRMAAKAFADRRLRFDDLAWFAFADQGQRFPESWLLVEAQDAELRYGENPHQQAALYSPRARTRAASPRPNRCRARSSATTISTTPTPRSSCVAEFRDRARPWSSSSTPIPAAWHSRPELLEPGPRRFACDSVSAFGGIVAVNRRSTATAEAICEIFTEVVSLPTPTRRRAPLRGKKNLRLLLTGELARPGRGGQALKRSPAGCWSRTATMADHRDDLKVVTEARADRTGAGRLPVRLDGGQARQVERHRLCQGRRTAGIGAGQMNRRDSARIAAMEGARGGRTYGWPEPRTVGIGGRLRRLLSPSPTACSPRPRPARRR
jgi:phosphoribosylaminoimidazolecarboxamide formyltransferase / IMP cyclohydrolase